MRPAGGEALFKPRLYELSYFGALLLTGVEFFAGGAGMRGGGANWFVLASHIGG